MRKIIKFIGLPCLAVLLFVIALGMNGCGGGSSGSSAGSDSGDEQASSAADNNASRALDTAGMSISTTIPSN